MAILKKRNFNFSFVSTGDTTKMTSGNIVYDKIHFRHDPKWSGRLGPAEGGGLLLCVACAIEMIESEDVSVRDVLCDEQYFLLTAY